MKEFYDEKIKKFDLIAWMFIMLLMTHSTYCLVFWLTGVKEMAVFNLFSVLVYVACLLLSAKKLEQIAYIISFIEIYLHQAFGAFYVGFNSGFAIVFTCLFFLQFTFFGSIAARIFTCLFTVISAMLAYKERAYFSGIYTQWQDLFYYVNIVVSASFMAMYGLLANLTNLDNNKNIADLTNLVYRDFLTGLHNRKYFEDKVVSKLNSSQSVVFAICDIDNFKRVNDTYGHDIGDIILKLVSSAILHQVYEHKGELSRWGGEEFLCKINVDNRFEAEELIESIREQVQIQHFKQYDIHPTITIGAVFVENPKKAEFDDYFKTADNQLYKGKKTGKNKVCIISA